MCTKCSSRFEGAPQRPRHRTALRKDCTTCANTRPLPDLQSPQRPGICSAETYKVFMFHPEGQPVCPVANPALPRVVLRTQPVCTRFSAEGSLVLFCLLVLRRECGNKPGGPLNGNQKVCFGQREPTSSGQVAEQAMHTSASDLSQKRIGTSWGAEIPWMDKIHFAPLGNHGKPLFVGIDRGIIPLGPLSWCRISSMHSMGRAYGPQLCKTTCLPAQNSKGHLNKGEGTNVRVSLFGG